MKNKQHIHIGTEKAEQGFIRFTHAWHQAKINKLSTPEIHLNFENYSTLLKVLTPKRLSLLKELRQEGPLSIRALAKHLKRDYKNVHVDVHALEKIGLIEQTKEGLLQTPWDIIDAHIRLAA